MPSQDPAESLIRDALETSMLRDEVLPEPNIEAVVEDIQRYRRGEWDGAHLPPLLSSGFVGIDPDRFFNRAIVGAYNRAHPDQCTDTAQMVLRDGIRVQGPEGLWNKISRVGSGIYIVSSERPGKRLMAEMAVHGDEIDGPHAGLEKMTGIAAGKYSLQKGLVLFAIGNEAALRLNVRSIVGNQNRQYQLDPNFEPDIKLISDPNLGYEHGRAHELARWASLMDAIIATHSTSQPTDDFTWSNELYLPLAKRLGVSRAVVYDPKDKLELIGTGTQFRETTRISEVVAGTLQELAEKMGIDCITLECGSHRHPKTLATADRFLSQQMLVLGIINEKGFEQSLSDIDYGFEPASITVGQTRVFKITHLIVKRSDNTRWLRPRQSFEMVEKGEALLSVDGEIVRAPERLALVIPTQARKQREGEEISLLARPVAA